MRKHAAQANIQNLGIANQKHIERNQDVIEGESLQCHPKKDSTAWPKLFHQAGKSL